MIIALLIGLVIWWLYFGLECYISGALGGWFMPFRMLKNDLLGTPAPPYGLLYGVFLHIGLPLFPLGVAKLFGWL